MELVWGKERGGKFSEKLHSLPFSWRFSKDISQVILRHEILAKGAHFIELSSKLPK